MTDTVKLPDYYRPISAAGFRPIDPEEGVGKEIQLKWIPIEKLYVDTRYQRDVQKGNKSNVRQIAKRFKWRRFSIVIVTPIEGTDCYTIIDGQYRSTGAALRGFDIVPCGIVDTSTLHDQADAFKHLNANTTKIMLYDIFKANLAAEDPHAVDISNLAKKCGIRFVSSNTRDPAMQPGDCRTFKSFEAASRVFKRDIFAVAAAGIAKNKTSHTVINGVTISALCQIFKSSPQIFHHPRRDEAVAGLDIISLYNQAAAKYKLEGGTKKANLTASFFDKLTNALDLTHPANL